LTSTSLEAQALASAEARSIPIALLWSVLMAFVIRLLVSAFTYQGFLDPGRDHWEFGYEMGQAAYSIASGHGLAGAFRSTNGPTAALTPVFPYILAGVFLVFGSFTKASALVILGVQNVFSALTCIPIYYSAKKSFGVRQAAWSAWLWVLFPYAIYFSVGEIWDRSLSALLLTVILMITLYLEDRNTLSMWALAGLVSGCAVVTNPSILSVLPFLGLWAGYRLSQKRQKWVASAAVAALVAAALILPLMIRNDYAVHRGLVLRDNFWLEFVVGNNGNALHWWDGNFHPSGNPAELAQLQNLGEARYMDAKRAEGEDFLKAHPGIVVWRSVRRFIYTWTGFWSLDPEYRREEPLDPPDIFFCLGFTILMLAGLRWVFREHPQAGIPYLVLLVLFPAVYYVTHPEMHFRHSLDPEIVILSACAIVSWLPASRREAMDRAGALPSLN
jgi:4-amino-4-deoxy-L-arabinose transferase-like glycosyltransferase